MSVRRVVRLSGRRSKYGARRTTVDGITFQSAKEARRYQELLVLEKAGVIRHLERQPVFQLCVPWYMRGANAVIGEYRADFRYLEITPPRGCFGTIETGVVEDVKGMKTPLYKWKKKHVEAQYGITVRET